MLSAAYILLLGFEIEPDWEKVLEISVLDNPSLGSFPSLLGDIGKAIADLAQDFHTEVTAILYRMGPQEKFVSLLAESGLPIDRSNSHQTVVRTLYISLASNHTTVPESVTPEIIR